MLLIVWCPCCFYDNHVQEASFWTVHPTVERLLQYRDLVRPFQDVSWLGLATYGATGGDACASHETTSCKGHNAEDLTYWGTTYYNTETKTYTKSGLTNEEIRKNMMPSSGTYAMPCKILLYHYMPFVLPLYLIQSSFSDIYEDFTWEHCAELGIVFKAVDESTYLGDVTQSTSSFSYEY